MKKIDGVDMELALSEKLRSQITTLTPGSIRFNNVLDLAWLNKQAIQRVYQTVTLIGRLPDLHDAKIGGQAIWLYVNSKIGEHHFDEFRIQDIVRLHTRPALHADYFSISITIPLKVKTIARLSHVTESINYNRVSQQLTASCHFQGASIVSFYVVARLNTGEITVEEAQSIYSTLIPLVLKEFRSIEESVDMISVATPITDILEKYIFSQANTKLADEMNRRRTGSYCPVRQIDIMMTTTTEMSRPVEAAIKEEARTKTTMPEPMVSGPAAAAKRPSTVNLPRVVPITPVSYKSI